MGECVIVIISEVTLKVISYSLDAPESRCVCVTVDWAHRLEQGAALCCKGSLGGRDSR